MRLPLSLRLPLALLFACSLPVDTDTAGNYIEAGSPDATAVLALVNDSTTTETILDIDVGLDRRAARNIIAFRAGGDAVLGTADDTLFRTVAELDDISYVGVSALTRLLDYARDNGYGTGGTDAVPPTTSREELIVAVANDSSLDFSTFDDVIGLDRRAAQGIVDRRPFASLDALDAVPYVGDTALARLYEYALANGYDTDDGDTTNEGIGCGGRSRVDCGEGLFCNYPISSNCGRADRGGFCTVMAETCTAEYAPVCGCNGLTYSNACRASEAGVSVDFVGACVSDLGQRCNALTPCAADLTCEGIAGEGSDRYGYCRPTTAAPGYWEECGSDADCGDDLACFGLALGATQGWCGDTWARRTFYNEHDVAIIDNSAAGVRSTVTARGLATAEMDVIISLDIRHTYRGDLRVVLTSPVGEEVVVFQGEPDDGDDDLLLRDVALGFPGDGSANGVWTLQITDNAAEDVGVLNSWALQVSSRWD